VNKVIKTLAIFLLFSIVPFSKAMEKKNKLFKKVKDGFSKIVNDEKIQEKFKDLLFEEAEDLRGKCSLVVISDYDEEVKVGKGLSVIGTFVSKLDKLLKISGTKKTIKPGSIERFSIYDNKIEKKLVKHLCFKRKSARTCHYIPLKDIMKEKSKLIVIRIKSSNGDLFDTAKKVVNRVKNFGYQYEKAGSKNYDLVYCGNPTSGCMSNFLRDVCEIIEMKEEIHSATSFKKDKAFRYFGKLGDFNRKYQQKISGKVKFTALKTAIQKKVTEDNQEEKEGKLDNMAILGMLAKINLDETINMEDSVSFAELLDKLKKKVLQKSIINKEKEIARSILVIIGNPGPGIIFGFNKTFKYFLGEVDFILLRKFSDCFFIKDESIDVDVKGLEEDIKRIIDIKMCLFDNVDNLNLDLGKINEYKKFINLFKEKYKQLMGEVKFVDIENKIDELITKLSKSKTMVVMEEDDDSSIRISSSDEESDTVYQDPLQEVSDDNSLITSSLSDEESGTRDDQEQDSSDDDICHLM